MFYFITFHGKTGKWTQKISFSSGISVADGYLAYAGYRASKTNLSLINTGNYSLLPVSEQQFKDETRYCW